MKASIRRTPEQWQRLIGQWEESGLSMVRFCEDRQIGYASFCQWRKRLAEERVAQDPEVSFIDIGALASSEAARGWEIVLCLGQGVELRLSRT